MLAEDSFAIFKNWTTPKKVPNNWNGNESSFLELSVID